MPKGQIVTVNFQGGIEEKLDPKQVQPGTILAMQNCRQQKTGRLERRYGSAHLADVVKCAALLRRQTELLAIDVDQNRGGQKLKSYSKQLAAFVDRDYVSEVGARRDPVKAFSAAWIDPTVAYGNGLEVWTWRTTGGVHADGDLYALIRDTKTGTVIRDEKINTGNNGVVSPKTVVMGGKCIVFYGDITAAAIKAQTLDLTNPTAGWGAPVTVRNDPDTTLFYNYFDVFATDANNVLLVYWVAGAVPLKAYRYDSTLAQQATATIVDGDALGYTSIAITAANNVLFVAVGKNAANGRLRFATLNATTLATTHAFADLTVPVSVEAMRSIGIVARDSTQVLIVGTWPTADVNKTVAWFVDSTGASTTLGSVAWLFQIGKPFLNGIDFYQLVSKANQNTQYLVNWRAIESAIPWPFRVSAVIAPRIATNATSNGLHGQNHLADAVSPSTGVRISPTSVIADASSKGSVNLQRARFDFADRWAAGGDDISVSRFGWCELGLVTHIGGGLCQTYDGIGVAETSFLEIIDSNLITLTPAGAGGSLGQGAYLYSFYWEVADSQGLIHRSAPSVPKSVTTPNPGLVNKVTITVPNLTFTNFARPFNTLPKPYLVVCRTLVNGLATAMFRVTLPDSVPLTNYIDPVSSTARITIVDTLDDVTLQTQALCYTATGAIPNFCPSSFRHVVMHRGRVVGIGDDGKTIWASTQAVNGEAVRFNEELQMQVDDELTALASLDDKLVIFSDHGIWVVYGDGPNDLGVQSDWTAPMSISTEVGCIAAQSVVRLNDGIYFQSRRGMYVLGRNLEVTPFKSPTDTIAANPCVTGSTVLLDGDMAMWACIPTPGGTSGLRLFFDTFHKTWGTDTFSFVGTPGYAVYGLTTFGGVLHFAVPDGNVYAESRTSWLDDADFYNSTFEIMGPNDTMSFKRVRKVQMLGEYFGTSAPSVGCNFKLSFAFDYGGYVQNFTWTAARLLAIGSANVELRIGAQNGANPRCRSLKIKGEILTPTGGAGLGTGRAASFSGIGFDIVPKPSMPRLGSANAST